MLVGRCRLPLSSPRRLKLEPDRPDLILTGIQMLVLDGYEATQEELEEMSRQEQVLRIANQVEFEKHAKKKN